MLFNHPTAFSGEKPAFHLDDMRRADAAAPTDEADTLILSSRRHITIGSRGNHIIEDPLFVDLGR